MTAVLFGFVSIAWGQTSISDTPIGKDQQFIFADKHRKLLKEVRIAWDPTENGAPTVHPLEPFGSEDVYGDIARISGLVSTPGQSGSNIFDLFFAPRVKLSSDEQLKAEQLFNELFPSLEILLQNGRLNFGEYKLLVKEPTTLDEGVLQIDFFASERDNELVTMQPPRPRSGDQFTFTEDHRVLLRTAAYFLRGNSRGANREEGYLDVPALDPKRPYGDMTYYPLDIARELGVAIDNKNYENTEDPPFKVEKLEKLVKLHLSMSHALILFLSEAEVDTGTYEQRDAIWYKIK